MSVNNSIALVPLDNRPVSYLLPKQIAAFSGIELLLPERNKLGDLRKGADLDYLKKWASSLKEIPKIIALDTWTYGGLVQSRRHDLTLSELKAKVNELKSLNLANLYAFSTVMRVANSDINQEEKEYWGEYGKKIFNWSELMHRVGRGITYTNETNEELIEKWYQVSKEIPTNVLVDYRDHREKNLKVNFMWLDSLHENLFKYLIFACDDSSSYGMNVVEAEYIQKQLEKHRFGDIAKVLPGADEISLLLITKVYIEHTGIKPKVSLYFSDEEGKNLHGRYESKSIKDLVIDELKLLDVKTCNFDDSDLVVCIHVAKELQGDHIFGLKPADTVSQTKKLIQFVRELSKPFVIVDLAYANGSDPNLISELLKSKINWKSCYGYAGWNTVSNTVGSVLSMGICRLISEKRNIFNQEHFKKCLFIRLLDDYAYQAIIRHKDVSEKEIAGKMMPYVKQFSEILELDNIDVMFKLPWKRSFEVEINVL